MNGTERTAAVLPVQCAAWKAHLEKSVLQRVLAIRQEAGCAPIGRSKKARYTQRLRGVHPD